jgi:hypothetical protein
VSRCTLATVIVAVLATAALGACSGKSPAAPSTPGAVPSNATAEGSGGPTALAIEGTYTLYLVNIRGQIVSSLPVNPAPGESGEVVLWAQVSGPGGLAQRGSVIFQACRGGGSGFTVWRPSAECDSGRAAWVQAGIASVTEGCLPFAPDSGNVCRDWGGRPIPQTIGFRYKFLGQGVIANGMSASQDMTWVE